MKRGQQGSQLNTLAGPLSEEQEGSDRKERDVYVAERMWAVNT